jgi:hypothetical protein
VADFSIDQLSMEASEKTLLREFVEAWDRHAQPVLFVGAGLSKFESVRLPMLPVTPRSVRGWTSLMTSGIA